MAGSPDGSRRDVDGLGVIRRTGGIPGPEGLPGLDLLRKEIPVTMLPLLRPGLGMVLSFLLHGLLRERLGK